MDAWTSLPGDLGVDGESHGIWMTGPISPKVHIRSHEVLQREFDSIY